MPYKAEHVSCAGTQLSVLYPYSLHRLLGMFRNPLKKILKKTKTRIQKKNHVDNFRTPPIFLDCPCSAAGAMAGAPPSGQTDLRSFFTAPGGQCASPARLPVVPTPAPRGRGRAAPRGKQSRSQNMTPQRKERDIDIENTGTQPKKYPPYRAHTFTPHVFAWQIMSPRAPASTGAVLPGVLLR